MHHTCLPAALLAACLAQPSNAAAAASCQDYAGELAVMAAAHGALRQRIDYLDPESQPQRRLASHVKLVDRSNAERLDALVARCGWPSAATHGEGAVKDAWLVVRHADHDPAFQKRVLALVEQSRELDQSFAYLYDRIAVMEKRPQHYGTQLSAPTRHYCALEFDPMDDRAQVEARRARLGMAPLDAYRRSMLEMQRCPVAHPADYHYAPPAAQGAAARADIRRK